VIPVVGEELAGRRKTLLIPLAAVAIIAILLYVSYYPSYYLAESITPLIIIKIVTASQGSPSGFQSQYVIPVNIGVPNGIMATTKYLGDGVDGDYPIFTTNAPCGNITGTIVCKIHVISKVARAYTLQDFFDVWGKPLGPDETLDARYISNSTASGVQYRYSWNMCIHTNGADVPSNDWGSHVLRNQEIVLLVFSQTGCG
jgi:hypothetical protein